MQRKLISGVIHLPALPGQPDNDAALDDIVERACHEVRVFADHGFDAVIVENFGDAPFESVQVDVATIAAMTRCAYAVARQTDLQVGVNVLRNDADAALAVAAAAGAGFIRINVHSGVYATDQGLIEGRAARTVRRRQRLCPEIQIFADVHVKHAQPLSQPDIALAAEETAYRGKADALIVSGTTTGRSADRDLVQRVKQAVPDRPVLLGSGVTPETAPAWLDLADGIIVGSTLRAGGRAGEVLDAQRVNRFAKAIGRGA